MTRSPKGFFSNARLFRIMLWSVLVLNVAWVVVQIIAIFHAPLRNFLWTPI